jgi:hypothetical protein
MNVPKYAWQIIASYMDIRDVVALETCSKNFQTFFDENFWRVRLMKDFHNDPSFFFFADVPCRQQYKEHAQYKFDPNEKQPFVQRVRLFGPGAQSVFDELLSDEQKKRSTEEFGQKRYNDLSGCTKGVFKVGLMKKTFELHVSLGLVGSNILLDAAMFCLGAECNNKNVIENGLAVLYGKIPAHLYSPGYQGIPFSPNYARVVCGLAEKLDFDNSDYPMQSELWERYTRAEKLLHDLSPGEMPEIRLFLPTPGVPYCCSDQHVLLLRTLLGELSFRLVANASLGKLIHRTGQLKRENPTKRKEIEMSEEKETQTTEREEKKEHKQCIIN